MIFINRPRPFAARVVHRWWHRMASMGIVNLTSCSRILDRSMEHDAFMLPSGRTSPGSKP